MARELNDIKFLFDYKTPAGFLSFGCKKNQLPEVFELLQRESLELQPCSTIRRNRDTQETVWVNGQYVPQLMDPPYNVEGILTGDILDWGQWESNSFFLIPIESVWHENPFLKFIEDTTFEISDMFSNNLMELIKRHDNVRLFFVDSREGDYLISQNVYSKLIKWLDDNNIHGNGKIIISTLNELEKYNIPKDDRFVFFNNEHYITLAGSHVTSCLKNDGAIQSDRERDNYNYDIRHNWEDRDVKKHFNMMNRNTTRLHRPYFVGRMIQEGIIDKGLVSLFQSDDFDNQTFESDVYKSVQQNYPFYIDEDDAERVSAFHNYLSVNTPYIESLFTIVGETNADDTSIFITEKTLKPIMNLHPFFVVGNPNTLKKLQELGFKTFSSIWDESYDSELNLEKRIEMIISEVKKLTDLTLEQLDEKIQKIKNICIYNRELLVKLNYKNLKYQNLKECLKTKVI